MQRSFEPSFLLEAVRAGCADDVRLLLVSDGADLERAGLSADDKLETPLLAAVCRRHVDIVRLLLDAGAYVGVACTGATGPVGTSPLHRAVEQAEPNLPIVRMLVDAGAAVNEYDDHLQTPLYLAVQRGDNEPLVTMLLLAGADPDARCIGESVLEIADANHWPLLLAAGADPCVIVNVAHRGRCSLLTRAIIEADSDGALLLQAAGARFDQQHLDWFKWTDNLDDNLLDAAKKRITVAGFHAIRWRLAEVCIALQDLELPAPLLTEIGEQCCAPFATHLPYHYLWDVAVCVKQRKIRRPPSSAT